MPIGALISAGASIAGGIMNRNAQNKAAKRNIAAQREFAQHGIRWKVEDAKAAGLHPLAALGTQTNQFSPVSVGDYGNSISQAGQDIGRAIDSTRDKAERATADGTMRKLALERAGLENDLLRSQIAKNTQAGQPPSRPLVGVESTLRGQGDSGSPIVKAEPFETHKVHPDRPHQEPGTGPDYGWVQTPNGWAKVPSKYVQERVSDMFVPSWQWSIRNLPTTQDVPYPAPHGYEWTGNMLTGNMRVRPRNYLKPKPLGRWR